MSEMHTHGIHAPLHVGDVPPFEQTFPTTPTPSYVGYQCGCGEWVTYGFWHQCSNGRWAPPPLPGTVTATTNWVPDPVQLRIAAALERIAGALEAEPVELVAEAEPEPEIRDYRARLYGVALEECKWVVKNELTWYDKHDEFVHRASNAGEPLPISEVIHSLERARRLGLKTPAYGVIHPDTVDDLRKEIGF